LLNKSLAKPFFAKSSIIVVERLNLLLNCLIFSRRESVWIEEGILLRLFRSGCDEINEKGDSSTHI